jgi:selenocysteine lyase/cysteine desulfurase
VVIDGYHGFMALETDLSAVADRVFYLAGGYKYAMAGEGCAFLHAPPGFGPRPEITGWYAEFDDLSLPPGSVGYAPDARRFPRRDLRSFGNLPVRRGARHAAAGRTDAPPISRRMRAALRDALLAELPIEAELLNPGSPARFLALRSPEAARWKAQLEAEDVIVDVRGDVLRIGFGLYQDAGDLEGLIEALASLA